MVELMIMYCVFWGALIIGAFVADFISDVSTSKKTPIVPRGTFEAYKNEKREILKDLMSDCDKYIQQEESEV